VPLCEQFSWVLFGPFSHWIRRFSGVDLVQAQNCQVDLTHALRREDFSRDREDNFWSKKDNFCGKSGHGKQKASAVFL